jgi:Zn-dependent protease/predicted transcriptional regulator
MFGRGITLIKLFGFEVKIDWSWLILAGLITWTLARGMFPGQFRGLPSWAYWLMGGFGALGILFSIVAHEFSHSLVARRFGMPIRQITLFVFGGVAQMEEESPSPRAELFMAIAGPIASVALGFLFWGVLLAGRRAGWPVAVTGVLAYMRTINFILAAFNLVPAFPLDGGRVLRAGLWKSMNDVRRATRIASRVGSFFGIGLIAFGIVSLFFGNFVGGIWWVLIGLFLRSAAQGSYRKLLATEALKGEPVKRFMTQDVVTVGPQLTVHELVQDYVYRYHYKMFPVVRDGMLEGCVTTREIKEVPQEEWNVRIVGEIAAGCTEENSVPSTADTTEALSKMNRGGLSRLMVVDDGKLSGVIALKDIMRFLSLKLDLEHGERRGPRGPFSGSSSEPPDV